MANKTGLGYSPLTERIYWGLQNADTGMWVGNKKKDVTNMFLQVLEHKFPINTAQNISCNGENVSTIYNIKTGRDVIIFDTINPDDIDTKLYSELAILSGLSYFDDHGCCESCSNDLPDGCECKELAKCQLMVMRLSTKIAQGDK